MSTVTQTKRITVITLLMTVCFLVATASHASDVQPSLPVSVKNCEDVKAFMSPDNSMTMETFKKLLVASGFNMDARAEESLDKQCKASAYVGNLLMSQHLLTKSNGGEIRATMKVIQDNGTCKVVNMTLNGC